MQPLFLSRDVLLLPPRFPTSSLTFVDPRHHFHPILSRLPTLPGTTSCDSIVAVSLAGEVGVAVAGHVGRTECVPDCTNPVYNVGILMQVPNTLTGNETLRFFISNVREYVRNVTCKVHTQDQLCTAVVPFKKIMAAINKDPIAVPLTAGSREVEDAVARDHPQLFIHTREVNLWQREVTPIHLGLGLVLDSSLASSSKQDTPISRQVLRGNALRSQYQLAVYADKQTDSRSRCPGALLGLTSPVHAAPVADSAKILVPQATLLRLLTTSQETNSITVRVYSASDVSNWLSQGRSLLTLASSASLPCLGECTIPVARLIQGSNTQHVALITPPTSPLHRANPKLALKSAAEPASFSEEPTERQILKWLPVESNTRWTYYSNQQLTSYSGFKSFLEVHLSSSTPAPQTPQARRTAPNTPSRSPERSPATPINTTQAYLERLQVAGEAILHKLKGSEYVDLDHSVQAAKLAAFQCEAFMNNSTAVSSTPARMPSTPSSSNSALSQADRQGLEARVSWLKQLIETGTKRLEEIISLEQALLVAVRARDGRKVADLIREAVYDKGLGHLRVVRDNLEFASWDAKSDSIQVGKPGAQDEGDENWDAALSSASHRILNLICLVSYILVALFAQMLLNQAPYPENPMGAEFYTPLLDGRIMLAAVFIMMCFFAARSGLLFLAGSDLYSPLRTLIAFGEAITPGVYLLLPFVYGIRATTRQSLSVIFALPWELMASIFVIAVSSSITAFSTRYVSSTAPRGLGYVVPSILGALLTLFLAGLIPTRPTAPGLVAAGLLQLASVLEPQWFPADLGRIALAVAYLVLEDSIRPIPDMIFT